MMTGILRRIFSGLFCRLGYHRWQGCADGFTCVWCGLTASWGEIFAYLDEVDDGR